MKDGSLEAGLFCLSLRFPGERLTQSDIAEVCGVSHQCIQQIEVRALNKLRAQLNGRGIQSFDVFDLDRETTRLIVL